MKSAYTKSKSGGFVMELVKKIKLTYQYYKSLGKKENAAKLFRLKYKV